MAPLQLRKTHLSKLRRLVPAVIAIAIAIILWVRFTLRTDQPIVYDDVLEHYKYGSIGSEPGVSLLRPIGGALPPYSVFTALPSICHEKAANGYQTFGFIVEDGHDLPVGISRRR